MTVDPKQLRRACEPSIPLDISKEDHQKYYIDFSSVRGGQLVEEMGDHISELFPDSSTCQLFTGHLGCGKSTELLRLKYMLERENFQVVYFESDRDLEMGDVDVTDILMVIARRVSKCIKPIIEEPESKGLKTIIKKAAEVMKMEIDINYQASLSTLLGKFTVTAKGSPDFRSQLRQYLEPRTSIIISKINEEILKPAIASLKMKGKKGLVVITDNLDRVDNRIKETGMTQPEYLFADRGEQLKSLFCHVVYTIPLGLVFSNEYGRMTDRFGQDPYVLPMVPVRQRNGFPDKKGMTLLRQMILSRAFPDENETRRLELLNEIFENRETMDRLCCASGGHTRSLMRLFAESLQKQRRLPITRESLEFVIRRWRNNRTKPISEEEWDLVRKVQKTKNVSGDKGFEKLLRSMFVFEYYDTEGSWFDLNPIIEEARELKE